MELLTQQTAVAFPNVAVNSICPGWCRTDMGGDGAPLSAAEGADTRVWLAMDAPRELRGKFLKELMVIAW